MSHPRTDVLRYLSSVSPDLAADAREAYATERSISAVYALARQYSPEVEQIARKVYASGCKAAHQRDGQRMKRQIDEARRQR